MERFSALALEVSGGDRIRRSVDGAQRTDYRRELLEAVRLTQSSINAARGDVNEVLSLVSSAPPALHFALDAFSALADAAVAPKLFAQLDDPLIDETLLQNAVMGGKALHLAEMCAFTRSNTEANIHVPQAGVVTTAAYNEHVRRLGLEKELDDLLTAGKDAKDLKNRLDHVRSAIEEGALFPALEAEIVAFVKSVMPLNKREVRFAVRSSSTQEDMGSTSFAGQYETFLNVKPSEVGKFVRKCWASMWQDRLFSYRENVGANNKKAGRLSMAVVVQRQIASEAAGVAFSLNPVSGDMGEVVVESVWGQGEGLVGGVITPHSWTVLWREGSRIGNRTTPQQKQKFALDPKEGVQKVSTTAEEQASAPLTDEQARRVSSLAITVASVYHRPYDIEWAREGDEIFLLQARPITSFMIQAEGAWSYAGFDDSCVLTLSMSAHAYGAMMSKVLRKAGGQDFSEDDLFRVFFSKAFLNATLWGRFAKEMKRLRKGVPVSQIVKDTEVVILSMAEKSKQLAPLREKMTFTPAEFETLLTAQDEFNTASFVVGEAAEHAEKHVQQYVDFVRQELEKKGDVSDDISFALLVEGINFDSEANYSSIVLKELTNLFAADLSVKQVVLASSDAPLSEIRQKVDKSEHGVEVFRQFDAFVRRFFFMSNRDEDVSTKRWIHDNSVPWALLCASLRAVTNTAEPFDVVLQRIKAMLSAETKIVRSRETEGYHRGYAACVAAVSQVLGSSEHVEGFKDFVAALRRLLELKEMIHVVYTVNNCFLRDAIVSMCFRSNLAQRSGPHFDGTTLNRSHPVFTLTYTQLKNIWALPVKEQELMLRNSHLAYAMSSGMTPPTYIGTGAGKFDVNDGADGNAEGTAVEVASGESFKGVGCSGGVASGHACVIDSLDEAGKMKKGDVLVTRYTDPSWTPLFSLACAVVLVDGGILSHAAVVARELKLPCVVQIKQAMGLNGVIVVDGSKGIVTKK